jgi:hypothetical protein
MVKENEHDRDPESFVNHEGEPLLERVAAELQNKKAA